MKKQEDMKLGGRCVEGTHRELEECVKSEYNQNVLYTCMEFPKIIELKYYFKMYNHVYAIRLYP